MDEKRHSEGEFGRVIKALLEAGTLPSFGGFEFISELEAYFGSARGWSRATG